VAAVAGTRPGPRTRPPARPAPRAVPIGWILAITAAIALLVWRGTLAYGFAQDDFAWLAVARGLREPLPFPYRWLSSFAYFVAMRPLGLEAAIAYRAVGLLAHAACAGLLAMLLARRFGGLAALAGATFFAVHPALFDAQYSISAINEPLALLFALLAIAAARLPGRAAWWAVPAFAAALFAKESVVLLPLALLAGRGWLGETRPRGLIEVLGWTSLLFVAAVASRVIFVAHALRDPDAPYALSLGVHIATNLLGYLGWAVRPFLPGAGGLEERVDANALGWGFAVLAAWALGLRSRSLRERGWIAGGVTFAALLAPVLGLRNHTYHYYLYAPLAGAAWLIAAGMDAAAPRGRAWLPLGLTAVMTAIALVRIHQIETMPLADPRLRANPQVDRARIAGRLIDGLRAAALPAETRLVLWSPASARFERRNRPGTEVVVGDTYWDRSVRAAVYEGLGIRLRLPQLASVRFARSEPVPGDSIRVALYEPDGTVRMAP